MKNNWKDSYDIIWQMSADHIADNGAGCYGKMGMVKKELQAFISNLLAEQKKELLLEVRTYIGDLDYEDMQTKGINQWIDEFIKSKGITL